MQRGSRRAGARAAAALLGVLLVLPVLGAGPGVPAARAADGTNGKVAGFGMWPSTTQPTELARVRALGANTVMLDVTWQVDDQKSSDIHPGDGTWSDQDLLIAAQRVQAAGAVAMLTLKVVCRGCPSTWRGALRPDDVDAWFASYQKMVDHYADLAQQAGVTVLFIASEMNSLQGKTAKWRDVAIAARTRFSGKLGYEVNWDTLSGVGFWDEVDIAGVSAYFPLTPAAQPNVADLLDDWDSGQVPRAGGKNTLGRRWTKEVANLAASSGKPVLFGEIGYQSAMYATERPYAEYRSEGNDEQLQADAYQAALTTFESQPWWLGAIWWEWKVTAAGPKRPDVHAQGQAGRATADQGGTPGSARPPATPRW